ncbi:hypothetical protein AHOG_10410 [Actinoalloteichus hoggarensis]|uniref:Uncharacterized protein n=1 Tax=Actinoalloteichus hoggarensis TaxID=1470176 RepID=A0A221W1M2_9PSEU|nr:hypothetical protein AHOG_10410 [Actinoalloteichus hoggarensis]
MKSERAKEVAGIVESSSCRAEDERRDRSGRLRPAGAAVGSGMRGSGRLNLRALSARVAAPMAIGPRRGRRRAHRDESRTGSVRNRPCQKSTGEIGRPRPGIGGDVDRPAVRCGRAGCVRTRRRGTCGTTIPVRGVGYPPGRCCRGRRSRRRRGVTSRGVETSGTGASLDATRESSRGRVSGISDGTRRHVWPEQVSAGRRMTAIRGAWRCARSSPRDRRRSRRAHPTRSPSAAAPAVRPRGPRPARSCPRPPRGP